MSRPHRRSTGLAPREAGAPQGEGKTANGRTSRTRAAGKRIICTKRAYEPPSSGDGRRVLVDRLWPRGLTKDRAHLDGWRRDLAPSEELRRWFAHEPGKFSQFRERYRKELLAQRGSLLAFVEGTEGGTLTLVYAAKDLQRNHAVVLRELLEQVLAEGTPTLGRKDVTEINSGGVPATFQGLVEGTRKGAVWNGKSEDLNVNIVAWPPGEGVAPHVNTQVDVLFVGLQGEGWLEIDRRRERMEAGSVHLVPRGRLRSIRAESHLLYLTCHRRQSELFQVMGAGEGSR